MKLLAAVRLLSLFAFVCTMPNAAEDDEERRLPERSAYREIDWQTSRYLGAFREALKQAQQDDAAWLRDPFVFALKFCGKSLEEHRMPDQISAYFPTGSDEAFFSTGQGEAARWDGKRIVFVIYEDVRSDDSIDKTETRLELIEQDGRWSIAWAGERFQCVRGDTEGWTAELCP